MSYNTKLEDRIDHYFIGQQEITKNKQMDGVGWLINGNMCAGIYQKLLVVRVDPSFVKSLTLKEGIQQFGHSEDDKKTDTFLSVSIRIYRHPKALHKFLSHALKFTSTLPSNEKTLYDKP